MKSFEQSTLWSLLAKQSHLPVSKRTNKIASFYTTLVTSWSTLLAFSTGCASGSLRNDMKRLMGWILCYVFLSELSQIVPVVLLILYGQRATTQECLCNQRGGNFDCMGVAAILIFGSLPGEATAVTSLRPIIFLSIAYLLNVHFLINCKWSAFECPCTPINSSNKRTGDKSNWFA